MKRFFLLIAFSSLNTAHARPVYYMQPSQRTAYEYNRRRVSMPQRTRSYGVQEQYGGESLTDFCRRCCAQGRNVSRECALRCNNCQAYSDEGASEARDFPN